MDACLEQQMDVGNKVVGETETALIVFLNYICCSISR